MPAAVVKFDPDQWATILKAIVKAPPSISTADVIATCSAIIAVCAVFVSWRIFIGQRRYERRKVVAQLHADWWAEPIMSMRSTVWEHRNKWMSEGDQSEAIRHFAHRAGGWQTNSEEARAHARIMFFFSDMEQLIASGLADEELSLRLFGDAQYGWFRTYFTAIRNAVLARAPADVDRPRFITDLAAFETRLDRAKQRQKAWAVGRTQANAT